MPNIGAANIACKLPESAAGGGIDRGPVLPAAAGPLRTLTASAAAELNATR
jgi:phosphotransacetylase